MNQSLRDSLRELRELGGSTRWGKGGELLCYAPDAVKPVTINSRRRDTPRELLILIRRLRAGRGAGSTR